ncbi:MAG: hypothetical protein CW338_11345 [Clostridiales bacterium]|nr:hypothetical protein [Clostridiales bacterium]
MFPSWHWQRHADENRPDGGKNRGIAGRRWGKVDQNRPYGGKNWQKMEMRRTETVPAGGE